MKKEQPGKNNVADFKQSGENSNRGKDLAQIGLEGFALFEGFYGKPTRRSRYSADMETERPRQNNVADLKQSGENSNRGRDLRQISWGRSALIDPFYGKKARRWTMESGKKNNNQDMERETPALRSTVQERFDQNIHGYYGKTKQSRENDNEPDLKVIARRGFDAFCAYCSVLARRSSYPGCSDYGGSKVPSHRSQSNGNGGNGNINTRQDSGNTRKDRKPNGKGDGNGNSNTIHSSDDHVLISSRDIPIKEGELPFEFQEWFMNNILSAKGRIISDLQGSDYLKFFCDLLLSGKSSAAVSWAWAQFLIELTYVDHYNPHIRNRRCHERQVQATVPSQMYLKVPLGYAPHLTPTLNNNPPMVNGSPNVKVMINNQNVFISRSSNGSVIFNLSDCEIPSNGSVIFNLSDCEIELSISGGRT